jgi:hypothetical protein
MSGKRYYFECVCVYVCVCVCVCVEVPCMCRAGIVGDDGRFGGPVHKYAMVTTVGGHYIHNFLLEKGGSVVGWRNMFFGGYQHRVVRIV